MSTATATKTIYLSGPISLGGTLKPEEISKNVEVFLHHAARLRGLGHTVLSPVEIGERENWEEYMKECLPMVCQADVVAQLPDWDLSRGARLEVFIAYELGILVLPVENCGKLG